MAAVELFTANEATTTVSSGGTTAPVSGTVETWTVASSSGFPAAATGVSQFHVADPAGTVTAAEIVLVTNVSGTTWTVTRGAESTTPVTHSAGFTVQQVITAGTLTQFPQLAVSNTFADGTTLQVGSTFPGGATEIDNGFMYLGQNAGPPPSSGHPFIKLYAYCDGAAGLNGWDIGIDTANARGTHPGKDFAIGPIVNGSTTDRFYMNYSSGCLGLGGSTPPSDTYVLEMLTTTTTMGGLSVTQSASNTATLLNIGDSSGRQRLWVDSSFRINTIGSGGLGGLGLQVNMDTATQKVLNFSGTTHSYNYYIKESDQGQLILQYTNGNTDLMRFQQGAWIQTLAPLDIFFGVKDGTNIGFGTTTGTIFGNGAGQKIGFFLATPVVQPSATGTTTGFTAGSGTAVLSGSTFTGNTGSTAYTVGDIVNALKLLGLMKA